MISISENLSLQSITINNHKELYELMCRIYPPAYFDYWQDGGKWYVDELYNYQNVKEEIKEKNSDYFFILFNNKNIGILRLVWNLNTDYEEDMKFVKLHRIYLDQQIQNQGIGKKLMDWLIDFTTKKGYKKLWLEVMEKQSQALHFYKKYNFKEVDKVFIEFPLVFDDYRGMYKMVKELN
ncbi:acetyltransferase (GNAT) family protein [Tenacibaculum adriaticum]|uniref:Acetyltransferase (GNAT) family protein n=1 Tax=Tenacibaculum adriaticum TaxID=413713 RepID=A0A5S5DV72_9FLAO|nr:GNAT family N-acetyltransferase [Tenacibaculum adriaticum]TYP99833.1 acetyltransferase (GNAT) family protein [Tenacibaculum adriaticum]